MLKAFLLAILIILFGILAYTFYEFIPGEPQALQQIASQGQTRDFNMTSSGEAKMFLTNLRFSNTNISYFVDPLCTSERKEKVKEAFGIVQDRTLYLTFYEASGKDAQITIGCSEEYKEIGNNKFIAGHGGPSEIIDTGLFNVILKGGVWLYQESQCDYPIVEIHEILHVLGFDHSPNPTDIMHDTLDCKQRIGQEAITLLDRLYEIEPLSDLVISEVNATKKGKYLDFEAVIKNQGLVDAENVVLDVYDDGDFVKSFDLDRISAGAGRVLRVSNVNLKSRSSDTIGFTVRLESGAELDADNNEAILTMRS